MRIYANPDIPLSSKLKVRWRAVTRKGKQYSRAQLGPIGGPRGAKNSTWRTGGRSISKPGSGW